MVQIEKGRKLGSSEQCIWHKIVLDYINDSSTMANPILQFWAMIGTKLDSEVGRADNIQTMNVI